MIRINKDIHWVGYVDWDLKMFHGYLTPRGSTYNAYLILDKRPTLIDTVKGCGADDMIGRIKEIIDPKEIKYIISSHTEMDHSGSIGKLLEYCPQAEVVCSAKGEPALKRHFKKDWIFRPVKTGDTLDIGKRKLSFVLMPMVHWPESMATYSDTDRILFPNDAFGQHYASDERFSDEVDRAIIFREAAKYYANIVLPYGPAVLKALAAISPFAIDMICPSHGLVWREKGHIDEMMGLYKKWANHETENRVVIVYDTMWHSTEKIARRLHDMISRENIPVKIMNLQQDHISDIVTEILSSKFLVAGTPILNNRMLPSVASLLMYLKGLRPQKRYALTFGSYGWSKAGFKEFEESLGQAGFELMGDGRYIPFVPDEKELEQLSDLVSKIQEKQKVV